MANTKMTYPSVQAATPRALREQRASDEGEIYRRNGEIHHRFKHVFDCPNSEYAWRRFYSLMADASRGKRVLDIGCGDGFVGRELVRRGAAAVHGIDVSETVIRKTAQKFRSDPRFSFEVADALEWAAKYDGRPLDVIVGSSILHHLDWKVFTASLYDRCLAPGGTMFFYEPLGENIALRLYWKFFPKAHTADERPFFRSDLAWLSKRFEGFDYHVTNYASFYAGMISTQLFKTADNPLTRAAHALDQRLERLPAFKPAFRYALFVMHKPAEPVGALLPAESAAASA
jgi:SAM-dependent methyltransferase